LVAQVKADYRKAAVDPKTRAMLEHGEQITRDASKIAQEDVGRLRAVGLSDEEILTGTLIAGFFNHQDRVADALGVALDDAFARRG
jgi:alkylhydroperoxidase family enzyme